MTSWQSLIRRQRFISFIGNITSINKSLYLFLSEYECGLSFQEGDRKGQAYKKEGRLPKTILENFSSKVQLNSYLKDAAWGCAQEFELVSIYIRFTVIYISSDPNLFLIIKSFLQQM